jgi:hypothetical protein
MELRCGYNKSIAALQFHHIDRAEKSFRLSVYGKSLAKLREEAKKCELVCANCHAEIEEAIRLDEGHPR